MSNSTDSALRRVLSAFQAEKASDDSWRGTCPACGHHSLIIKRGDKAPVVGWCSRDCDKTRVNTAIYNAADLKPQPFTVERFCQMKKLPPHWVEAYFLVHDAFYKNPKSGKRSKLPSVCFPYLGEAQVTRTGTSEHYERPSGFKFRFSEDSHKTAWMDYKPMLYGLHMLPYYSENDVDTSVVTLVEGESDTITLAYNGICTFGIPGAPHGWKADYAKIPALQSAKRILVVQEPDDASKKLIEKIASSFPPGKVWVVKLHAKDPSELWINSARQEDFQAAWKAAVTKAEPLGPIPENEYVVESMADIQPKPITWLWPGRIPRNKLTVFAGNPGTAKSLVTCSLAAIVSTGDQYPDEAIAEHDEMDVLMFFCEDDAEDTVVPRLMAAGADLKRIFKIKRPMLGADATRSERELAFDTDRAVLEKFLTEHPSVKLVIVDPISSYVGNIKPNDEKELRAVLVPLSELGNRLGVTFVLVAHFNKRSDVSAIHKVLGAVAMTGVARSAWLFAEDADAPEGTTRYLMLQGKMNVGRKQKGLEYTIGEKQILPPPADETPFVKWGNATDVTAEKAFSSIGAFKDEGGTKTKQAGQFLQEFLANGDRPARDVYAAAKKLGISERTLEAAKKEAGVKSIKLFDHHEWHWPSESVEEEQAFLRP